MLLVKGSSKTGILYDYVFGDRNFGNTKSMRSSFVSKYLKLHLDFKNAAKNSGKVFCYLDNCIWIGIVKLSLFRTFHWEPMCEEALPRFCMSIREIFPAQLTFQRSMNMIKVLWRWFQKWLGTFTMLVVEGYSETFLFRHLYHYVFGVRIFGNKKSMRVMIFYQNN